MQPQLRIMHWLPFSLVGHAMDILGTVASIQAQQVYVLIGD